MSNATHDLYAHCVEILSSSAIPARHVSADLGVELPTDAATRRHVRLVSTIMPG